jgi:hypothetical protein
MKIPETQKRNLKTLKQQIKEMSKWNTPLVTCGNKVEGQ